MIAGVYETTKSVKSVYVEYNSLSPEHKKQYDLALDEVSQKHPIKCVCGRLCTGLHERTCSKFRAAVTKNFLKRIGGLNERSK